MLPALVTLTHMTRLEGGWQQDSGTGDVVVLPSVVELASACGSPPFAALPNLVTVEQYDWLSMDAFASMARHCKGLRELKVLGGRMAGSSMQQGNAPKVARIDAWMALLALIGLTCCECMVADTHELAAVVKVVRGLLASGFQRLSLGVLNLRNLPVFLKPLLLLAKLQGLPNLLLHVESVPHSSRSSRQSNPRSISTMPSERHKKNSSCQ
jgi:hypothetical protein